MAAAFSLIPELNLLKEFEDSHDTYADGFYLTGYGDLAWFAEDPEPDLVAGLIGFGKANSTGSIYAVWRRDDRRDLATLPVVVFGDEGGQHVVARGVVELLQLLSYDCEIEVRPDTARFHRDEGYQPSRHHLAYLAWLDRHFRLPDPLADPNDVVQAAQARHGEHFAAWVEPRLEAWWRRRGVA